jgi:hypothetical protein
MNIPKWVWLLGAAAVAFWLLTRKSASAAASQYPQITTDAQSAAWQNAVNQPGAQVDNPEWWRQQGYN